MERFPACPGKGSGGSVCVRARPVFHPGVSKVIKRRGLIGSRYKVRQYEAEMDWKFQSVSRISTRLMLTLETRFALKQGRTASAVL